MVQKIILIHENNRSGIRMTNPVWRDQYFPTEKIDRLLEETIMIQILHIDGVFKNKRNNMRRG